MRDAPKAFGGGNKDASASPTPYSLLPTLYSIFNRRVEQSYYTEFHRVLSRSSTELMAPRVLWAGCGSWLALLNSIIFHNPQ